MLNVEFSAKPGRALGSVLWFPIAAVQQQAERQPQAQLPTWSTPTSTAAA